MNEPRFHLIHANIALARGSLDQEIMSGFVQQVEEINNIANSSNGFVSQPTPSDSGAVYSGKWLLNLSVWESVESLSKFTHSGKHALALDNRNEWFKKQDYPNYVLFWFHAGNTPKESEIEQRIGHLAQYGATPYAFNFKQSFTAQEAGQYVSKKKA
jgi:hypothetical protein|tara:strand:+ start:80 stop:550 length:471 start_codon:yes stop_codon:yes gene_type:complete